MKIRENLKTIVVAMVTAAVTAGAPAIAHGVHARFAHNADKVDGKHAVGARASTAQRKGKLVATSGRTGRLPNNIIAKAPNADRLDGIDSDNVLPGGIAPAGTTVRGTYWMGGEAHQAFDLATSEISFGYTFASAPVGHFIASGTTPPAGCPGTYANPQAAPGHLCVYEGLALGAGARNVSEVGGDTTTSPFGAWLFVRSTVADGAFWSGGRWAATAPSPGAGGTSTSSASGDRMAAVRR